MARTAALVILAPEPCSLLTRGRVRYEGECGGGPRRRMVLASALVRSRSDEAAEVTLRCRMSRDADSAALPLFPPFPHIKNRIPDTDLKSSSSSLSIAPAAQSPIQISTPPIDPRTGRATGAPTSDPRRASANANANANGGGSTTPSGAGAGSGITNDATSTTPPVGLPANVLALLGGASNAAGLNANAIASMADSATKPATGSPLAMSNPQFGSTQSASAAPTGVPQDFMASLASLLGSNGNGNVNQSEPAPLETSS